MKILVLVNALTFLRVIFSLLFAFCIKDNFTLPYLLLLFLLICATDFMDGKLARHYGTQTKFGAYFDIGADIFFVIISYWVLIDALILPLWILIVAICKFSEFLLTSARIRKKINSPFLFDKLGKLAAILLYILPIIAIITYSILPQFTASDIICVYLYIVTILVIISSVQRIWSIVKK